MDSRENSSLNRDKFFQEARERFHRANNDLFSKRQLQGSVDGVSGGSWQHSSLFPDFPFQPCGPSSHTSQLAGGRVTGAGREAGERRDRGERVIPILIQRTAASDGECERKIETNAEVSDSEQSIPVVIDKGSNSSSSSSGSSTPREMSPERSQSVRGTLPGGPGVRASFHHPSFANNFGFSRLGNGFHEACDFLAFRESMFPGFPNFGNFPLFTPNLMKETQVNTDGEGASIGILRTKRNDLNSRPDRAMSSIECSANGGSGNR